MSRHSHKATKFRNQLLAPCIALAVTLTAAPSPAQKQEEILTFKGEGDSPIKVLNEKGEVQEEIREDQIKKFIVAPKWSVPKRLDDTPPKKEPARNAVPSSVQPAKPNKTIDEMLKERKRFRRKSTAKANRPPKKTIITP